MIVEGKVHLIGEVESFGNNGFTKRLIVVATDEQYVQHIPIDFVKDKTDLLNNHNVGDLVKISVNMRGNEHNGKYYLNFQGWRVESVSGGQIPSTSPEQAFAPIDNLNEEESQDLPF